MNYVALITGSSGGIGQALVERFSAEGYRVIGLDLLSSGNLSDFIQVDLIQFCRISDYRNAKLSEIDSLISEDNLSVLINNAAIQIVQSTDQLSVDDWFNVQDVNVNAAFLLAQGLLSRLQNCRGSIINISSIHASLTKPGFVAYASSKAALEGLTRALAVDIGHKVRVNAISPAAIATNMLLQGFKSSPEALQHLSAFHPVKKIGATAELAELAIQLASSKFEFLNGSIICFDGGIRGRLHDPA